MTEHKQKGKNSVAMFITALVMILLFCVFAIFLVSQGQSIGNVEEMHAQNRLKTLAELNAENEKVLTQYHWVDKSKGVVGVPIDRAMDLVLVELQSIKPPSAGPVTPPPAPAQPAAAQSQASPAPSPNSQKPGG